MKSFFTPFRRWLDWWRLRRGSHFRCQGCRRVKSAHDPEGYFSRLDTQGLRYWCRSCADNDPDIGAVLRRMDEHSQCKRRAALGIRNRSD